MPKKIPERTCLGCGKKRPKREMIRIVRTPGGGVEIDPTGKKSGRGAYVCPDQVCFSNLQKQKRLEKAMETPLPPSFWEELSQFIEKQG